jgi:hypothetical protein
MPDDGMVRAPAVSKLGKRWSCCTDSRAGLEFYPTETGMSGLKSLEIDNLAG